MNDPAVILSIRGSHDACSAEPSALVEDDNQHMEGETIWPVGVRQRLALSLAALTMLAGAAVAQMNPNHLRAHRDQSTSGTSIDDVVKQLSNNDPEKRLEAVRMLGASKDGKATEYLIKAVGDADVRVQAKAIQVLGDLRATDSTPVLVECLFRRSTEPNMKQLIAASLGKIGDQRAARPLIELLRRDLDVDTRGTAIFALGEIGAPEAVDVLAHIAQTDENQTVRRIASEARSKIDAHHEVIGGDVKDSSSALLEPKGLPQTPESNQRPH